MRSLKTATATTIFKQKQKQRQSGISAILDSWYDDDIPTITVPNKMMQKIQKLKAKIQDDQEKTSVWQGKGPLVISCKRAQYNHRVGQRYGSGDLNPRKLASYGWKNNKSAGDWIIIQPFMDLPAFHYASMENFDTLNVRPELMDVLKRTSVGRPTYIQEMAIPTITSGSNVIIASETGSGKTLAYLLPIIKSLMECKSDLSSQSANTPSAVILAPSRELANQIATVASSLCDAVNLSVKSLCGGQSDGVKRKQAVDIVIATPGILRQFAEYKLYNLSRVQHLVLDEGDTLLDDSFNQLILSLFHKMNIRLNTGSGQESGAQVIIVAATMPRDLNNILGDFLDVGAMATIVTPKLHYVPSHIKQRFERVKPSEKSDIVIDAIKRNVERSRPTLVFCNRTPSANHLGWRLEAENIDHCLLNGQMPELMRRGRFESFQNGISHVLIATDVASRGLDTTRVRHVINYEFPQFMSDYIHRVGRVGRVGSPAACMATSYVSQKWEVDALWTVETSVRKMTELHNVNANIKRKLVGRHQGGVGVPFTNDDDDVDYDLGDVMDDGT